MRRGFFNIMFDDEAKHMSNTKYSFEASKYRETQDEHEIPAIA
jgi:hypothetical protein